MHGRGRWFGSARKGRPSNVGMDARFYPLTWGLSVRDLFWGEGKGEAVATATAAAAACSDPRGKSALLRPARLCSLSDVAVN